MRDGDADLADLTKGEGRIRVVARLRGQVKCHGEAGLALLKQVLVAAVCLLGGGETGVLAHGPQTATVHGGLHATSEGELGGVADLAGEFRVCNVAGVVQRIDFNFGCGFESLLPLLLRATAGP